MSGKYEIWIVDDSATILNELSRVLGNAGYFVVSFNSAAKVLACMCKRMPDVIISDIIMPGMNGVELAEKIRGQHIELPLILMSSAPNMDCVLRCIKQGVIDFLTKPIVPEHLLSVIRRAITMVEMTRERERQKLSLEQKVRERTEELEAALRNIRATNLEVIHILTNAAKSKDNETGLHIKRIGMYSYKIAKAIGMSSHFCSEILHASPMHDIGKIGIPDSLLFKGEQLSPEEFEIMKTHTGLGARILENVCSKTLKMASEIALHHHEKWDGSGYPNGLSGSDIPLSARIVLLADQYDALRCQRPYKNSMTHACALAIMQNGDERTSPGHFDPDIFEAFLSIEQDIAATHESYCDGRMKDGAMDANYIVEQQGHA